MYSVLAVLAVVACASAQMYQGGMNMNNYNNLGMNQMGGMNNMYGMNNMGGWGQMGGNMNNMGGGMNMNNMGGNMGGRGGGQQQGVMGAITLLLLQNLISRPQMGMQQQQQPRQQQQQPQMDSEEMDEIEEYMRWKMMTEMSEMMMQYMDYKEKEKTFTQAMEAMCFMVNATYEAYRRRGENVFNQTTDATMEELERTMMGMTEAQKMDYAVNMLNTNMNMYSEIFMRIATWACMAGDEYAKVYNAMERMNNGGGGECDRK